MGAPRNTGVAAASDGLKSTPARDTASSVLQTTPPSNAEWAGRETIADVTKSSEKKFQSLPPRIHEMLRLASAQLFAQYAIVHNPLARSSPEMGSRGKQHISAVEQFEWARYELDAASRTPLVTSPSPAQPQQPPVNELRRPLSPKYKFGDQQSDPTLRAFIQHDYVQHLISQIKCLEITRRKLEEREKLRLDLAKIVRKAMEATLDSKQPSHNYKFLLHCYGSFSSGFALQDSDMDLLFISKPAPPEGQYDVQELLLQAFLSAGFGASLVPSVRKPGDYVIKVWTPSPKLARMPSIGQSKSSESPDGSHGQARNDIPGSQSLICRLQLFKTALSIHTTMLLRCYHACDRRVHEMVFFVKRWARARRINNPENGFLSSYGYTLMVLHYLMNIANPPVIPNLQRCDRNRVLEWADDYEVFFWRNPDGIARAARNGYLTQNQQSTASLLCGFFAYYSITDKGSQPFVWNKEVISIRDVGGVLQKTDKGWIRATGNGTGVISRYLLAIADPFEEDHNVAWTVNAKGLPIIMNEFDRANRIINRVQLIPGVGWEWRYSVGGVVGEDFFATREEPPKQTHCKGDGKNCEASNAKHTQEKVGQVPNRAPLPKRAVNGTSKPKGTGQQPEEEEALCDTPNRHALEGAGPSSEQTAPEGSAEEQVPLHFDPMQLRDLATIQAGGNGCWRVAN